MPTARLSHFETDASRARDVVALGQRIGTLTVGRVDASDMYRAGLVQIVSAMDHYFHGVVLDRAVDLMLGRLTSTSTSTKVGVSFDAVRQILATASLADQELAARTHVSQCLALETFQKPDDIGSALSIVGIPKLWSTVFGNDAGSTKLALGLIVTRRNRIVHQSDSDPLTPGMVTPLSDTDALGAIDTVTAIVRDIDAIL
ncbi:hypothetical protein ACFPER_09785 [Agromyces aurantiacus]|uniref:RiboL-PSP-HEPN domain-containing protein n=1 Tax=Agromyces aurantiacus TaxID=165814 RepID=A0ABV9R653_9MICO|nr:hypothetical protein [Agromyces aurantiacus]MBM7503764.1 restriction system protein [Agromyces aurantiacus]